MKSQYVISVVCLPCTSHPVTLALVPYLVFTYDYHVEDDSWRIYFRAVSSFVFLVPPVLALIESPPVTRRIVSSTQSLGCFGLTLILLLYTVLFGLSNASVLINSHSSISDAALELADVSCQVIYK